MLVLLATCVGCRTAPTQEQTTFGNILSRMITDRDSMGRNYVDGHLALRALLENRNDRAKLTFKKNVEWSSLPVPEIEALLLEVDTQLNLIQADLTSLDGYMYRKGNANNQIQNIGTNAPNSDL